MKFLIQTVNGEIVHDFVFELQRSLEYLEWKGENHISLKCELENIKRLTRIDISEFIPVGTVEFVMEFASIYINSNAKLLIKPINVPNSLLPFTLNHSVENYKIWNDNREDINNKLDNGNKLYIKSNEKIKSDLNGVYLLDEISKLPIGNYQIGNYKDDILSEYRCFVYQDKLRGLQFYSGDYEIFPNMDIIHNMMSKYKWDWGKGEAPQAYTLDVYVNDNNETGVIECHEFFSCGLYGFSDYQHLPYMFERAFNDLKKRLQLFGN